MKLKDFVLTSLRLRSKKQKTSPADALPVSSTSGSEIDRDSSVSPSLSARNGCCVKDSGGNGLTEANWQGNVLYQSLVPRKAGGGKLKESVSNSDYMSNVSLNRFACQLSVKSSIRQADVAVSQKVRSSSSKSELAPDHNSSYHLSQQQLYISYRAQGTDSTLAQGQQEVYHNCKSESPLSGYETRDKEKASDGFFRKSINSFKRMRKRSSRQKASLKGNSKENYSPQLNDMDTKSCAVCAHQEVHMASPETTPNVKRRTKTKKKLSRFFKSKGKKENALSENFDNAWICGSERFPNERSHTATPTRRHLERSFFRDCSNESCSSRTFDFREGSSVRDLDFTSFESASFGSCESDLSSAKFYRARSRIKTNPWIPSPRASHSLGDPRQDYELLESGDHVVMMEEQARGRARSFFVGYRRSSDSFHSSTHSDAGSVPSSRRRSSPAQRDVRRNLNCSSSVRPRPPVPRRVIDAWSDDCTALIGDTTELNDLNSGTSQSILCPNSEFTKLADHLEKLANNISLEYEDMLDTTMESGFADHEPYQELAQFSLNTTLDNASIVNENEHVKEELLLDSCSYARANELYLFTDKLHTNMDIVSFGKGSCQEVRSVAMESVYTDVENCQTLDEEMFTVKDDRSNHHLGESRVKDSCRPAPVPGKFTQERELSGSSACDLRYTATFGTSSEKMSLCATTDIIQNPDTSSHQLFNIDSSHQPFNIDSTHQPFNIDSSHQPFNIDSSHQPFNIDSSHQPFNIDSSHQPFNIDSSHQPFNIDSSHQPFNIDSSHQPFNIDSLSAENQNHYSVTQRERHASIEQQRCTNIHEQDQAGNLRQLQQENQLELEKCDTLALGRGQKKPGSHNHQTDCILQDLQKQTPQELPEHNQQELVQSKRCVGLGTILSEALFDRNDRNTYTQLYKSCTVNEVDDSGQPLAKYGSGIAACASVDDSSDDGPAVNYSWDTPPVTSKGIAPVMFHLETVRLTQPCLARTTMQNNMEMEPLYLDAEQAAATTGWHRNITSSECLESPIENWQCGVQHSSSEYLLNQQWSQAGIEGHYNVAIQESYRTELAGELVVQIEANTVSAADYFSKRVCIINGVLDMHHSRGGPRSFEVVDACVQTDFEDVMWDGLDVLEDLENDDLDHWQASHCVPEVDTQLNLPQVSLWGLEEGRPDPARECALCVTEDRNNSLPTETMLYDGARYNTTEGIYLSRDPACSNTHPRHAHAISFLDEKARQPPYDQLTLDLTKDNRERTSTTPTRHGQETFLQLQQRKASELARSHPDKNATLLFSEIETQFQEIFKQLGRSDVRVTMETNQPCSRDLGSSITQLCFPKMDYKANKTNNDLTKSENIGAVNGDYSYRQFSSSNFGPINTSRQRTLRECTGGFISTHSGVSPVQDRLEPKPCYHLCPPKSCSSKIDQNVRDIVVGLPIAPHCCGVVASPARDVCMETRLATIGRTCSELLVGRFSDTSAGSSVGLVRKIRSSPHVDSGREKYSSQHPTYPRNVCPGQLNISTNGRLSPVTKLPHLSVPSLETLDQKLFRKCTKSAESSRDRFINQQQLLEQTSASVSLVRVGSQSTTLCASNDMSCSDHTQSGVSGIEHITSHVGEASADTMSTHIDKTATIPQQLQPLDNVYHISSLPVPPSPLYSSNIVQSILDMQSTAASQLVSIKIESLLQPPLSSPMYFASTFPTIESSTPTTIDSTSYHQPPQLSTLFTRTLPLSLPTISRPIESDTRCLADKVKSLCQDKSLVFMKIRRAQEKERLLQNHRATIQRSMHAMRKDALLQTLHELRARLEEQSGRLAQRRSVKITGCNPFEVL